MIRKRKKALYYPNSNESQIFKKNQLKVRKVNVSVTNQVLTKSEKIETEASKSITKILSECQFDFPQPKTKYDLFGKILAGKLKVTAKTTEGSIKKRN